MSQGEEIVTVPFTEYIRETPKGPDSDGAHLVVVEGLDMWFPKSLTEEVNLEKMWLRAPQWKLDHNRKKSQLHKGGEQSATAHAEAQPLPLPKARTDIDRIDWLVMNLGIDIRAVIDQGMDE